MLDDLLRFVRDLLLALLVGELRDELRGRMPGWAENIARWCARWLPEGARAQYEREQLAELGAIQSSLGKLLHSLSLLRGLPSQIEASRERPLAAVVAGRASLLAKEHLPRRWEWLTAPLSLAVFAALGLLTGKPSGWLGGVLLGPLALHSLAALLDGLLLALESLSLLALKRPLLTSSSPVRALLRAANGHYIIVFAAMALLAVVAVPMPSVWPWPLVCLALYAALGLLSLVVQRAMIGVPPWKDTGPGGWWRGWSPGWSSRVWGADDRAVAAGAAVSSLSLSDREVCPF